MATRRVKRSKKQVHRARDRKTNRRRQRHTRRHQGGMFKSFAKFVGTKTINPKGGQLYDGIEVFSPGENVFHIGNRRLDAYDASTDPNDRVYADKIRFYLKAAGIQHRNDMIVIDQSNFDKFVAAFASNKFVPTAAAAPVASAAPASTCQDHVNGKGTPNSIIMTQYPSCIAYVNHDNIYEMQSLSRKQPKYSFKNFTIELRDDSVIVGKLELDFSNGANPVSFTLELNLNGRKDTDTKEFVSCMNIDELTYGIVTVTNVTMERSMLKVIGNVTPQKTSDGEMYDFQGFVTKFAEQYQFCTKGIGQKLENAAQLNREEPRALAREIYMNIIALDKRMPTNAKYVALKQMYSDFMSRYPDNKIDATKENLTTLNEIHERMGLLLNPPNLATKMGQLTFEPTGDDLAARLAALKDD